MTELSFSGAQIELILELLEEQQSTLLVEIRHTDTGSFRKELKERLRRVEALLERFRGAKQPAQEVNVA